MIVPLRRLSLRVALPKTQPGHVNECVPAPEPRAKKPTFFENFEAMWTQFADMVLPKTQ